MIAHHPKEYITVLPLWSRLHGLDPDLAHELPAVDCLIHLDFGRPHVALFTDQVWTFDRHGLVTYRPLRPGVVYFMPQQRSPLFCKLRSLDRSLPSVNCLLEIFSSVDALSFVKQLLGPFHELSCLTVRYTQFILSLLRVREHPFDFVEQILVPLLDTLARHDQLASQRLHYLDPGLDMA